MIKAIGFDYGGVIGGVGYNGVKFTQQAAEILGVSVDEYLAVYFSMNRRINTGEIDNWHIFWKLFIEKIGKPEKLEALIALNDESDKHLLETDQNMLTLIDELRRKGYKTGLLSNTTAELGRQLREMGVAAHFDTFLISAEMKLMKPEPEAFRQLTDTLGVDPGDMIFIDDAVRSLSTAADIGFHPILFTSYDQLRQELESAGIITL